MVSMAISHALQRPVLHLSVVSSPHARGRQETDLAGRQDLGKGKNPSKLPVHDDLFLHEQSEVMPPVKTSVSQHYFTFFVSESA